MPKPEPPVYEYVHESFMGEQYLGCFEDKAARDIPTHLPAGDGNYKACFEAAQNVGLKYAGLQAGSVCFGGEEYGKYGEKEDKECNQECNKDKGKMCGAGWRNSVFMVPEIKYPAHETIMGESYVGCFVDKAERDLPHNLPVGNGHYKKCFDEASRMGYKFAGLQYSAECWAGNEHGKYGKKPDAQCHMECRNDAGHKCGSTWRNSVFEVPELVYPPHETIRGEKYLGCYVDTADRDITHHIPQGDGSYTKCFEFASRFGYKYAGLQNGSVCFGGHEFGKYGKVGDGQCNMDCTKEKGRMCGAGWRNSVFEVPEWYQSAHEAIMGEEYVGCFADTKERDLPHYHKEA